MANAQTAKGGSAGEAGPVVTVARCAVLAGTTAAALYAPLALAPCAAAAAGHAAAAPVAAAAAFVAHGLACLRDAATAAARASVVRPAGRQIALVPLGLCGLSVVPWLGGDLMAAWVTVALAAAAVGWGAAPLHRLLARGADASASLRRPGLGLAALLAAGLAGIGIARAALPAVAAALGEATGFLAAAAVALVAARGVALELDAGATGRTKNASAKTSGGQPAPWQGVAARCAVHALLLAALQACWAAFGPGAAAAASCGGTGGAVFTGIGAAAAACVGMAAAVTAGVCLDRGAPPSGLVAVGAAVAALAAIAADGGVGEATAMLAVEAGLQAALVGNHAAARRSIGVATDAGRAARVAGLSEPRPARTAAAAAALGAAGCLGSAAGGAAALAVGLAGGATVLAAAIATLAFLAALAAAALAPPPAGAALSTARYPKARGAGPRAPRPGAGAASADPAVAPRTNEPPASCPTTQERFA
jgi:hypothetical protein